MQKHTLTLQHEKLDRTKLLQTHKTLTLHNYSGVVITSHKLELSISIYSLTDLDTDANTALSSVIFWLSLRGTKHDQPLRQPITMYSGVTADSNTDDKHAQVRCALDYTSTGKETCK